MEVWSPKAGEKPGFEEAKRGKYRKTEKGERFGPSCESRGGPTWAGRRERRES